MNKFGVIIFLLTSLTSFGQMNWKSLNDIPKKWIMLERDSAGYLIYKPCNGGTPMITIDSGYITIYWRLDAPGKLLINKFTRLTGKQAFYISSADQGGNTEFNVEVKDAKRNIVLWTFNDFKWVMTPLELKNNFRQIGNPCPDEMKREIQFLPVEF